MAVHLRGQSLSLREIAAHLVITKGKKGRHPSAATVLREHDEKAAAPAAGLTAPARVPVSLRRRRRGRGAPG